MIDETSTCRSIRFRDACGKFIQGVEAFTPDILFLIGRELPHLSHPEAEGKSEASKVDPARWARSRRQNKSKTRETAGLRLIQSRMIFCKPVIDIHGANQYLSIRYCTRVLYYLL